MKRIDPAPDTRMGQEGYMDAYDFDRCVECGKCLYECIYNDLTLDQAIDAIRKMRQGDINACETMLDHCVFCYNCNDTCPVDAHPAALMLARLHDRRNREGVVSASLRYMINGMETRGWQHNFFTDLYTDHDKKEKDILEKWAEPKDCAGSDLLWCSCATRIFPYDIEYSHALAGLQKFGGKSDCCGLPAMRSGLFDEAKFLVGNLIDRLSQSRFNRLVIMCGSCQDMFQDAMPTYLGQAFPFKIISIYEYLEEQIQNGTLQIQRQVSEAEKKNTCIFHSCFGHQFGEGYLSAIRRLYEAVGYDCAELAHTGDKNICCGMGGIYRKGNLRDMLKIRGVKKKDFKQSQKKQILAYCYGCFFVSHLFQGGTTHFLLEKLLWALGDDIKTPVRGILGRSFNFSTFKSMMAISPSALF